MKNNIEQIIINAMGRTACDPDWSWDTRPGLVDFDLLVIEKGVGNYCVEGTDIPVSSGQALLLRPGTCCLGTQDRSNPMTVWFVHFDCDDAASFLPRDVSDEGERYFSFLLENPGFCYSLLDRMLNLCRADAGFWLRAVLFELRRQQCDLRWTGVEAEQEKVLKGICRKIRNAPELDLSDFQIGTTLHCTDAHATRLFKKYIGLTPQEFRMQCRIETAQGMLLQSALPLKEIAARLRYGDIYAFCRQFREKTGVPPGAFRRQRFLQG